MKAYSNMAHCRGVNSVVFKWNYKLKTINLQIHRGIRHILQMFCALLSEYASHLRSKNKAPL